MRHCLISFQMYGLCRYSLLASTSSGHPLRHLAARSTSSTTGDAAVSTRAKPRNYTPIDMPPRQDQPGGRAKTRARDLQLKMRYGADSIDETQVMVGFSAIQLS